MVFKLHQSLYSVYAASILLIPLIGFSPTLKADHGKAINVSFGGRLKIDTIYNANSVGGSSTSKSDLAFSPSSVPIPENSKNSFDVNFRESRVWGALYLPLGKDTLSTYVEFDFFDTKKDASGRSHVANDPRMRHLYFTFKNFTVGKTYTTFVNLSSYPEINDANGPLGVLNIRQELIRYSQALSWGEIFLALEKGESTFTSPTGGSIQVNDDQDLDIVGKISFEPSWGNVTMASIFREIDADNRMMSVLNDTEWGTAFSIAGRIYLPRQNNLRFNLSYGNVLGRYMSFNVFDDATIDNTGRINLTEVSSAYLAYQHWWTKSLRSSFVVGAAYANQDTSKVPLTVDKLFISSHTNLLWSPTLKMTLGLEWIHGYRELENGHNGDIDRLQLSAVYKF